MSRSWRDVLPVHPAAELFPMLPPDGLLALGEDIKKNGLRVPIVLFVETLGAEFYLLDGRNRLDAMEATGQKIPFDRHGAPSLPLDVHILFGDLPEDAHGLKTADPISFVLSANIHRRHLTIEQKRDLIAKVLKARPGASNRQIAAQVKADDKTVGKVRKELEATAEVPQLDKTIGKGGKARTTAPKAKPAKTEPTYLDLRDFLSLRRQVKALETESAEARDQAARLRGEIANIRSKVTTVEGLKEAFYNLTEADQEAFLSVIGVGSGRRT